MKWPLLGGFWALSPANMTRVCWNFNQRYVFHKTKTVSEQSFKIKCLSRNETYPKLMVLVLFWTNFPPENPKYCQKPNFLPESTSLWLSNNTSSRYQINHRILMKLMENPIFWAKYGLFMVKNRQVNKNQEVKDQVSIYRSPKFRTNCWWKCFVITRLKLALLQFQCHSFYVHAPLFWILEPVLGVTPSQQKKTY